MIVHLMLTILLNLYTLQNRFYLQYDWNHFFSKSSLPILHMVCTLSSTASLFHEAILARKVKIGFIGIENLSFEKFVNRIKGSNILISPELC